MLSLHSNSKPQLRQLLFVLLPNCISAWFQTTYFATWVPNHVLLLSWFFCLLVLLPYFFSSQSLLEFWLLHVLLDSVLFRREKWRQYLIYHCLALNLLYSQIYANIYGLNIYGLELLMPLPLSPECWNYRHILPHLAGLDIKAFPPECIIPLYLFFHKPLIISFVLCFVPFVHAFMQQLFIKCLHTAR